MSGEPESKDCQVIVVSNRLPYQIDQIPDVPDRNHDQTRVQSGKILTESVSGLVTALKGGLQEDSLWFGGVIKENMDDFQRLLEKKIPTEGTKVVLQPVSIPRKLYEQHRKWSNGKLWPVLHGMLKMVDPGHCWEGYEMVSKEYANSIATHLKEEDKPAIVWIHDYHLFLVPKLLKEILADKQKLRCSIGFFLHIPFPPEQTLKELPNFKKILEGLLGSDSIGFHTPEYCLNFLECCEKHTKYTPTTLAVGSYELHFQGRKILVKAVPAGIVYETFSEQSKGQLSEKFPEDLKILVNEYTEDSNKTLMIGVDRIDYTKGLLEKVKAFQGLDLQKLLKSHPERKVLYLQIAVPCRTNEPNYKKLGEELKKKVKDATASLEGSQLEINFFYDKLSPQDLSVLYKKADVALVTPLIDGLNLVASEYIACQTLDDPGVLILSKKAGVEEYLHDALKVDPENGKEMEDAMYKAITMPREERKEMMDKLQKQVKEWSAERWVRLSLQPLRKGVENMATL